MSRPPETCKKTKKGFLRRWPLRATYDAVCSLVLPVDRLSLRRSLARNRAIHNLFHLPYVYAYVSSQMANVMELFQIVQGQTVRTTCTWHVFACAKALL